MKRREWAIHFRYSIQDLAGEVGFDGNDAERLLFSLLWSYFNYVSMIIIWV